MIGMLFLDLVEVKWIGKTKKWYVDKGYEYTKLGDLFMVLPTDLTKGSHVKVKTSCDYCNEIIYKPYKNYLSQTKNETIENSCENCQINKSRKTWLENYGVDNPNKSQEIRDKTRATNLERYGVEYPLDSDEIRKKSKDTLMKNYGVENPTQSKVIQQKMIENNIKKYGVEYYFQTDNFKEDSRQSNIERYGVENYTQTDEYLKSNRVYWNKIRADGTLDKIVEKRKATNLEMYGYENVMQHPDVQKKAFNSYFVNGTAPSSKEQRRICELVDGVLNFPSHPYMLDIAFPEDKVYVEYDGGGHDLPVKNKQLSQEQFNQKELKRSNAMLARGWKEIRVINPNDRKISSERIIEFIKEARTFLSIDNNSYIALNVDNNTISYEKNMVALKECHT